MTCWPWRGLPIVQRCQPFASIICSHLILVIIFCLQHVEIVPSVSCVAVYRLTLLKRRFWFWWRMSRDKLARNSSKSMENFFKTKFYHESNYTFNFIAINVNGAIVINNSAWIVIFSLVWKKYLPCNNLSFGCAISRRCYLLLHWYNTLSFFLLKKSFFKLLIWLSSQTCKFANPRPPFFSDKLNLSVADFGWCLFNFVNNVLILMFTFWISALVHFTILNEWVNNGTA